MNLKDSYFHGGNTEHGLIKDISLSSSTLTIAYADKDGTSKTINLTGIVPSTSDFAKLLKPIANTTTASASTWSIPSGSKQVWGEKFSDSTLKYTPSGGSATTITDTGDLVMFLTPSANSNSCSLNIRIDGTFYGSFDGGIKVTLHLVNDVDYPLIWSNQTGNSTSISSLFKSWKELYYNPANKRLTTGHLATLANNTYDIGAKTVEYANTFTRVINSRYLNACATVDDHSLYIGYGNNVDTVTNKTLFYYSYVNNNAVVRTLMAEVNSSCFKMYNTARIEGANGLLYIRGTGTGDNYSVIRFGNDTGDDKAYIFLNSSDRTNDGGASLMTIRNNVGDLRLNNDVNVTGRLSIGSSNSSNYITFYGLGGDGGNNYDSGHTYIGNRLYAGNDRSELLIFLGNDISYNTTSLTTTTGTQDRIRHISGAHVFQAASASLSGTFENVGNSDKLVNLVEFNKTSADFYTKALFKYNNKTKLELRADNEGGNIRIYSPDSYVYYTNTSGTTADNYWEIDAYNDNLRFYTFTPGNATTLSVTTPILTLFRTGGITASKFVKTSGTSSQFLKADGSVDSTAYLPLSGGTMTGELHLSYAASGTMDTTSTNPAIKFSDSGLQWIKILYTDYDSYRTPYGLKIIGDGSSNTGAWFEVEGDIYAKHDKLVAHAGNVSTGDNNGLVKIAGVNVSVKGLGSNAYTSTAYIPLAGTSTSTPITGTLYSKAGLYIYKDANSDVEIWHIDGDSTAWDNNFGFTLKYLGSNGANDNDLVLYSHNLATGNKKEVYRVHQDGLFIFGADPYVSTNKIAHAGNVSNKSATIGTSDTVIATIAGIDIKAKIASYLPTSGGTISNATFGNALTIRRTSVGLIATIRFQNYSSGTTVQTLGYIGMSAVDGHLVRISGTNTKNYYNILDTSDFITSIASTNTDTQVPTAKAVYTAINNLLATNDALVYKGTLAGNANNTNGGTLTPAANKGWVYKVNQSGYINGVAVEVGDMLICNTDNTPAATTSGNNIYSTVNAKWDFIQANLDPNQYVTVAGIQSITGEKTFTKANIGQLYVTGLAQFTNVISGSINGNAATTDKLKNARTLKVNLATTTAQLFDGSANAESIGVTGTLPTANGGTGNVNGTIPYTKLTGSTTTANQAIVSSGTANGWTLKTLGSNAFNSTAYLPLTGGTVTGTLTLSKELDLSGTADNSPALIICLKSGSHLELDGNEIQAKATATTVSNLYLNNDGGDVYIKGKLAAHAGNVGTGDNNGQVKIAGTNVTVKGINTAAYTESTNYILKNSNTTITWTDNSWILTNKNVNDTISTAATNNDSNWKFTRVSVNKGDKFLIKGRGGSSPRLYAFVDSNNKLKTKADDVLAWEGEYHEITAGLNGFLIVNINKSYAFDLIPISWVSGFLTRANSTVTGGGSTWGNSITVNIGGVSKTLTIPSKPTYTLDDVTDGTNRKLSNYLPLTGGIMTGAITLNGLIAGIIAANTDIDTLSDGIWNTTNDGNSLTLTNVPTLRSSTIFKFTSFSNGSDIRASYLALDTDGKAFIRGSRETNSPWRTLAHSGNSTQSAVTLTWGTNSNALKIAGTLFNVVLPSNPDRYVNSAGFAMNADNGIKMTLTRAGADTSTVTATISQLASTTGRGLTPKLALASTDTIATQASEYVLTYKSGTETTPVWRKLPANAWNNTTNPTWTSNASDAAYPIGFCTTASPTSGSRYNDYYNTMFTFNPSTKSLKINGCTLQYDSTNKCLKFIFTA